MNIISLIVMLAQVAVSLLQAKGVISSNTADIATAIDGAIPGLQAAVTSGGGVTPEIAASLTVVSGAIAELQQDTSLPADVLARLGVLSDGIQAALVADEAAQTTVDPSTLTPIAELPVADATGDPAPLTPPAEE